ncbi:MAG: helix-turn-helix transcriptional regulator [Anaerotignum sp.]|nr:helix-turn-helix transcriptional regulator [Anaerotignum sp.]
MSAFAANLKKIRKNKKVSQKVVAQQLGYGYTAIANYESGRNEPSIDDLIKIADYFDVSVDHLVGREYGKEKMISQ